MGFYVSHIHRQKSDRRLNLLCDMLLMSADQYGIPARSLCEALLSNPSLDYKSSEPWCKTFQVVDRIIVNVDYKVCNQLSFSRFSLFMKILKVITQE